MPPLLVIWASVFTSQPPSACVSLVSEIIELDHFFSQLSVTVTVTKTGTLQDFFLTRVAGANIVGVQNVYDHAHSRSN
jgi:hypothetical protein